jgi:hypothetical protein
MLAIPSSISTGTGSMIYIPTMKSLEGSDGIAIVIGTDSSYSFPPYQQITVVGPSADSECKEVGDYGSALVTQGADASTPDGYPGIVVLNDPKCGLITVDPKTLLIIDQVSKENYNFIAEEGAHSHPVFDKMTTNLYFIDFGTYGPLLPRVCCSRLKDYQNCDGWRRPDGCIDLPSTGSYIDGSGTLVQGKWSFLAMAYYNNYLYITASGPNRDDAAGLARYGYKSSIFVIVRGVFNHAVNHSTRFTLTLVRLSSNTFTGLDCGK